MNLILFIYYSDTCRSDKARCDKLLEHYKKVRDNNRRMGAERMAFEYEEIGTVLVGDPIFDDAHDSENKRHPLQTDGKRGRDRKVKRGTAP
ncbi:11024_t:CDS:2 [Paraglomus occultum]|uniref:11024_t:CDS:1 n=1 Tax=Paraglomus occultum TaxID=144539 RepID=A0A9N9C6Y9_9GLOM|nr:11024_t:CDS:2 [Paraglomus occultum]